jgi:CBS domain-containing protein
MKMKAVQIMQRSVLAATPQASVRDIALQLVNNGISGMPIVERNGTVRGMVTEADILRVQIAGQLEKLTAKDIMSANPIAVEPETPIEEVKLLLQEYHILRVPVTENGKLIGIISRSDIIKAMLQPEFLIL